MKISAELSMYPLSEGHRDTIEKFLEALRQYKVKVITNTMSTRVFGEYDEVWKAIQTSYAEALEHEQKAPIVLSMRVLSTDLDPAGEPFGLDRQDFYGH